MSHVATPLHRTLDEVIAGSGRRLARVDILPGPGVTPGEETTLPVVSGSVTVDYSAAVRRTASLTVADVPDWVLADAQTALGVEVQVWQGVVDDAGAEHWWSQGVFSVTRLSVSRTGAGRDLSLDLTDRSHRVKLAGSRRRWAASGSDYILATISNILAAIAPWLPINIDPTGDLIFGDDPLICEYGDDPWDACRKIARSVSRDLHVDRHGVVVAPPITNPLEAVPTVLYGLTAETVETDVEDVVNVVGCPWEENKPEDAGEDWVPDGGIVEATDDATVTGTRSPLGPRARLVSGDTSVVHTPEHAGLAAQADLNLRMGLQRAATGSVVPDPRLDVGVPVDVHGATHIVSRLDIDLAGGATGIDMGAARPEIAAMLADVPRVEGRRTTEIVTGLAPLRTRSVTDPGGAEVTVRWTDALAGVEVGDPITVLHEGAGSRVGVALLVKKPLSGKHAGEDVGMVGGEPVTVGGDARLRARITGSGGGAGYGVFADGDVDIPTF